MVVKSLQYLGYEYIGVLFERECVVIYAFGLVVPSSFMTVIQIFVCITVYVE